MEKAHERVTKRAMKEVAKKECEWHYTMLQFTDEEMSGFVSMTLESGDASMQQIQEPLTGQQG